MMEMRRRRRTPPQPPVGGGPTTRRRKLDIISTLPDDLLGEIISLLPVKDGGRTQTLASRWRHLWRAAPLNLDCRHDQLHVSDVLEARAGGGPTRRFCVRKIRTPGSAIRAWLRSAALDNGLQELQLEFDGYTMEWLPEGSIFRFSNTLRALTLANCMLLYPAGEVFPGLHFPHLKLLGLECVTIRDDLLQCFVDACPALEVLFVHTSPGFRRLRINSFILTTICVRISDPTRNRQMMICRPTTRNSSSVIETVPRLQRLIHLYEAIPNLDVSVFSAPTSGILGDWHSFYIGLVSCSRVMQKLPVDSPTKAVHTVKSLAVNMKDLSLDNVVDLMRLFPCLEELYVKSRAWSGSNCWRRKHRNLHEIRLKTVVLEPYMGYLSHVNFAKFFILNAGVMESMTFHIKPKFNNDTFLAEQRRKLELENMVSRDARIHFTTASCQHSAWNTKQLRHLGLNDPFVCRR